MGIFLKQTNSAQPNRLHLNETRCKNCCVVIKILLSADINSDKLLKSNFKLKLKKFKRKHLRKCWDLRKMKKIPQLGTEVKEKLNAEEPKSGASIKIHGKQP